MERLPKPNEIYRHFKGNLYRIVTLAKHSETGETMVVYQALYGDFGVFVRPLGQFAGEVDHDRYPGSAVKHRFTLVPQIMENGGVSLACAEHGIEDMAGMPSEESVFEEPAKPSEELKREDSLHKTSAGSAPSVSDLAYNRAFGKAPEESLLSDGLPEEEEPALDPMLMEFLDAGNYRDKMNILTALHARITDEMLNTIAVSMDLELPEGEVEDRYQTIKNCIRTLEKYECQRLR